MRKIFFSLLSFCLLCSCSLHFGSSDAPASFFELPEVAQDSDVHSLSSTYCKTLWVRIKTTDQTGAFFEGFSDRFSETISDLVTLIENIKNSQPILIGGHINLSREAIFDAGALAISDYFDSEAYATLKTALINMSVLNKHKGGSDFDSETNAHLGEILVYVWGRIKTDPVRLPAFLIGLIDAANTCIQGYSVRMLCSVHPPKLKAVAKK